MNDYLIFSLGILTGVLLVALGNIVAARLERRNFSRHDERYTPERGEGE